MPGARKLQIPRMKAFQKVERYHFAEDGNQSVSENWGEDCDVTFLTLSEGYSGSIITWTFHGLSRKDIIGFFIHIHCGIDGMFCFVQTPFYMINHILGQNVDTNKTLFECIILDFMM
jgi:hypothetical protein